MAEELLEWITAFPPEWAVLGVGALPVFELRGAIPLGISLGLPAVRVYFLALAGNLLPVVPLLFIFKYFFHRLENIKFLGGFLRWWFRRVERKSSLVERWGFWGLIVFVAVPLPVTGAWTGAVAASLLEMKIRKAFPAILIGVAIAGVVVSLVAGGVVKLGGLFSG